jgi:Permuted papain-like amidase enzyme, YaeF/YiiX, C92 family
MSIGKYRDLLKSLGFQSFLWTQFLGAFNDNVYKIVVSMLAVLTLIAWPDSPLALADSRPFTWDRMSLFKTLEQEFSAASASSPDTLDQQAAALDRQGRQLLDVIDRSSAAAPLNELAEVEAIQFHFAALAAARRTVMPRLEEFIQAARVSVMRAAGEWPTARSDVHEAIYRIIEGGRTAVEEAAAQHPPDTLPALVVIEDIPSATPSAVVNGVTIHSGDIVLSRGGAPTSALIARGNDFPGHFSHAALVHVDPETGAVTVIEALIDRGVVLTTLDNYLKNKKFRILLLRLRPEHPVLAKDPQAPHRAATVMLARAKARHIPYDFAMDWKDATAFFCSEVPYHAYQSIGVDLWSSPSHLSSPGLVAWLGSLGVRHFVTLVPSDLEYDPDLAAVAEWRNPDTLQQDRLDNVTMDALLEGAEQGARLDYPWYQLPVAEVVKTWSVFQMFLGFKPVIPEGISASIALRVDSLSKKVHPVARQKIELTARCYETSHGHQPPYWVLMDMARRIVLNHRGEPARGLPSTRGANP